MNSRTRRKIIIEVFKNSSISKFLVAYMVEFFIVALLIMIFDENINNYGDSLWYCFVACTTIGFGDITATGLVSRLLTVFFYAYTTLLIALITALFTQIFVELLKAQADESAAQLMYDLEHLPDLSKEELAELSRKIKEKNK